MSHDVQQVRSFEHPGEGRKRAKSTPKGRQVDPDAAHEIELLLGDRPRRRDLLIEHLHLIQDKYQPDFRRPSRGARRRDEAFLRRSVRDRDLLRAFRRREGRRARYRAADHPRLRFPDLRHAGRANKLLLELQEQSRSRHSRRARALRRPAATWRRSPRSATTSCIMATSPRCWRRPGAATPIRISLTMSTTTPMWRAAATSCSTRLALRRAHQGRHPQGRSTMPACAGSAAPVSRPGANGARCSANPGRG